MFEGAEIAAIVGRWAYSNIAIAIGKGNNQRVRISAIYIVGGNRLELYMRLNGKSRWFYTTADKS